nr:MBL fold metallo-hydrolase [uncultured Mogibacterium sp.]
MITVKRYDENMLQENTYVLMDSEMNQGMIIDPGCYTPAMKTELQHLTELEYIILTHAHGDHMGALNAIRRDYPDAVLIAGAKEKNLLLDAENNGSMEFSPEPVSTEADRYVSEGDSVTLGSVTFTFMETPGHTEGGICICGDGKIFTGDTLFFRSIGRTDLYSGNMEQMRKSLQKLMSLPDEIQVLPGHGPGTSIGAEKKGNPFV